MLEIKKFRDIPWSEIIYDCSWYSVFSPPSPVSIGHQIWVPKEDNMAAVRETLTAAYRYTSNIFLKDKRIGYKIIMEYGECSGAQISWPHINLIPININSPEEELS